MQETIIGYGLLMFFGSLILVSMLMAPLFIIAVLFDMFGWKRAAFFMERPMSIICGVGYIFAGIGMSSALIASGHPISIILGIFFGWLFLSGAKYLLTYKPILEMTYVHQEEVKQ